MLDLTILTQVEDLIAQGERQWEQRVAHLEPDGRPQRMLPLVRLRVTYENQISLGNIARFGQEFAGRIANPNEVLQLQLRHQRHTKERKGTELIRLDKNMLPAEKLERVNLSDLVLENVRLQHFDLLNARSLQQSVMRYVEKDERDAIEVFLERSLSSIEKQLATNHMNESRLQTELERISMEQASADIGHLDSPPDRRLSQDAMERELETVGLSGTRQSVEHVEGDAQTRQHCEPSPSVSPVPGSPPLSSTQAPERGPRRKTARTTTTASHSTRPIPASETQQTTALTETPPCDRAPLRRASRRSRPTNTNF